MGSVVVVMVGTVPRSGTDPLVTGTAAGIPVDCGGSDPAALQGALDLQGREYEPKQYCNSTCRELVTSMTIHGYA